MHLGNDAAIFTMLMAMPGGKNSSQTLKSVQTMDAEAFESRWAAD